MRKESVVAGWTGKVLTGQIDRRSFMERLAALGLTGAAIGTLSSLIPDVAQAAGDPTTLLIATSETPPGLDTEYNASRSSHEGIAQTMDALVQFDKKVGDDGLLYCDFDNLKGALAESWEIDPDGKAVTFHLRKGVMSHWGNELTADDVYLFLGPRLSAEVEPGLLLLLHEDQGSELDQGARQIHGQASNTRRRPPLRP